MTNLLIMLIVLVTTLNLIISYGNYKLQNKIDKLLEEKAK